MPINNSRISLGDLKYENHQKTFSYPENHGTSGTLTVSKHQGNYPLLTWSQVGDLELYFLEGLSCLIVETLLR